jgi:hypothetical protein
MKGLIDGVEVHVDLAGSFWGGNYAGGSEYFQT